MSYMALARKWRPRTFSQLVGQEHINKSLINALNQQRIHHAYLFTGTHGVGKTSLARILAKALNCEQGIGAEPCLVCETCVAIEQGRFIDLIEIDGASKTRVEDTRDLLENIHYAPASGRYKVYIIDEVHMLSQHSFNALLKTLEEPPSHVKFILATTDPQKVPVTVLSRCLQFSLHNLSPELICQQLKYILNEEKLSFEEEAVSLLARAAKGSMRDGLSILDQAITRCDTRLLASDIRSVLGYTQHDYALRLLQALSTNNAAMLLESSRQIAVEGSHFSYVLDELLTYLHHIAIHQSMDGNTRFVQATEDIQLLAQQLSAEDVQLFYQIALKGSDEMHLAPTLAIGFNMTLLRMLTFKPAQKAVVPLLHIQQAVPENPVANTNEMPEPTPIADAPAPVICTPEINDAESIELPEPQQPAVISAETWVSTVARLPLTGFALKALEQAEFISKEGKEIILGVERGHLSLFTPTNITRIEAALTEYCHNPVKIKLDSREKVIASPAQEKEKTTQLKRHDAENALQADPVFQQLQNEFSADVIKNSIVLLNNDL